MKIKEISAGETYIEHDADMHTATIDIVYNESESKEMGVSCHNGAIECNGDGEEAAEILRDHILLCVSMHDELVEALRGLYELHGLMTGQDYEKARSVLAKLESTP